jgi:hypothetical protein
MKYGIELGNTLSISLVVSELTLARDDHVEAPDLGWSPPYRQRQQVLRAYYTCIVFLETSIRQANTNLAVLNLLSVWPSNILGWSRRLGFIGQERASIR